MNRKQLIAAAAFALIGSSAFAVEAERVVAPQGPASWPTPTKATAA
jgi:hypothetical protein